MATENLNVVNTRIALKIDTLTKWDAIKNTFVPMLGEVCLVQIDSKVEGSQLPPIMFKVGDGESTFAQLDWACAKAADVYDWAKKSEVDFIAWAKTNIITQTEVNKYLTNYYTKEETDTAIETAVAAEAAIARAAEEALGNRIDAFNLPEGGFASKEEFNTLKSKVEDEDGALARANAAYELADAAVTTDELTEATKDFATKTEAQGYADAKDEAIQAAQNTATAAKNRIDAFIDGTAEAETAIDTLVEIQQYMTKDTEAFTALSSKVTNIENGATVVPKATDATTLNGKADTAFATAEQGAKADNAAATIATYGDIVTRSASEFQPAGSYQPAGNYKTIQEVVAETGAADKTLKISQNANGEISVTPVDIAIAATQVSGLATIATSGSINDVAEVNVGASNVKYLVFNCGSATTLID